MTTENDIIFDSIYDEVSPVLDDAIDNAVETIIQEYDISVETAEKIIDTWLQSSAPSQRLIIKNAEQLINKHKEKLNVSNSNR